MAQHKWRIGAYRQDLASKVPASKNVRNLPSRKKAIEPHIERPAQDSEDVANPTTTNDFSFSAPAVELANFKLGTGRPPPENFSPTPQLALTPGSELTSSDGSIPTPSSSRYQTPGLCTFRHDIIATLGPTSREDEPDGSKGFRRFPHYLVNKHGAVIDSLSSVAIEPSTVKICAF